jgi:NADH-quinone oxidoreductase subunit L
VIAASYDWVPTTIAWIGVITALFAATIALAQNDIKKVLAYSTVSQIGYMMLAVGTGGYVAAIFHMVTHAAFKALLFLGAGSVIHGMHDEQDMRRMGALRTFMPITAGTFIVGWLAIAGVPPFSGFWSKDEILLFALAESPALYIVGILTAILTAFYMTRQVIMVFFGEARWTSHANEDEAPEVAEGEEPVETHHAHGEFKPHESPPVMWIPLAVLAVLAALGGVLNLPRLFGIPERHVLRTRALARTGDRVRRGRHHRHLGLRQQVHPRRDRRRGGAGWSSLSPGSSI